MNGLVVVVSRDSWAISSLSASGVARGGFGGAAGRWFGCSGGLEGPEPGHVVSEGVPEAHDYSLLDAAHEQAAAMGDFDLACQPRHLDRLWGQDSFRGPKRVLTP